MLSALIASAAFVFAFSGCGEKKEPVIQSWEPVADWLTLPDGMESMGASHGDVAVSENGDVYVSLTGGLRAGVQVYGADGKFVRNVKDAPKDFHGFVIHKDADGIEYICGPSLSTGNILKMKLDGEVVMTIPASAIPEEHWKKNKNGKGALRLTACDVAPNGDIFVTDGYSSDLIHRFNAVGEYQTTFGGKAAPYNFKTLHKIAVDTRFDPVRIAGVSRTDGRVVHMTTEGEYLGDIATGLMKPAALVIHKDHLAIGEILGRVTILDKEGKISHQFGANENTDETGTNKTEPAKWRTGIVNAPHGVALNQNGDLFVTEYSIFGRILKYDAVKGE